MPNQKYITGRDFEYRVMAYLRKRGYLYVTRSAGSHGIIDVHAAKVTKVHAAMTVPGKGNEALIFPRTYAPITMRLAIQVKHGKSPFGPEDAELLIEWAAAFDAIPVLASSDAKDHIVTSRVEKTGLWPMVI